MVDLELFVGIVNHVAGHLPKGRRDLLQRLVSSSRPANKPEERTVASLASFFQWKEATVRTEVKRLEKALRAYYNNERYKARQYQVVILPGGPEATQAGYNWLVRVVWRGEQVVQRFWQPHLNSTQQVEIISNAPLFHRSKDGSYRLRVMSVNDRQSRDIHRDKGSEPKLEGFEECFHYVSLGDFRFVQCLVQYFSEKWHSVKTKVVHASLETYDLFNPDHVDLAICGNLVAIGNPRVSWVVRNLEELLQPDFRIPLDSQGEICDLGNVPPEEKQPPVRDKLTAPGHVHAIVIRSVEEGRVRTLINVQNGPALEGMARLLTHDELLEPVFREAGWLNATTLPDYFELLFELEIAEKEALRPKVPPKLLQVRPRAEKTRSATSP